MRRPARIVLTASVVPAVLLGLVACTQPTPLPLVGSSSAAVSPSPTASVRQLSVQSIAGRALRQVGSGTVTAVEDESAGTVWDVRVVQTDGSVQELHLSTAGRVLAGPSSDTTDADQQSTNRALVAATSVSLAGAVDRMAAAVPKGRVTAVQLSQYEDRVVWQGDVTNADGVRQDVRIDAVNGSVLLNRTDGQQASGGS